MTEPPLRITWKWVRESKFPALVSMARRAGLDPTHWQLTYQDTPVLWVSSGVQYCAWTNPGQCADYLQAWIDALSIVELTRHTSTVAEPAPGDESG